MEKVASELLLLTFLVGLNRLSAKICTFTHGFFYRTTENNNIFS
jgi:hypothetical protein